MQNKFGKDKKSYSKEDGTVSDKIKLQIEPLQKI